MRRREDGNGEDGKMRMKKLMKVTKEKYKVQSNEYEVKQPKCVGSWFLILGSEDRN